MEQTTKKKVPKIPEGFQAILESLSYDVLRAQPKDVLRFCVENLTAKLASESRNNAPSPLSNAKDTDTCESICFSPVDAPPPSSSRTRRQGVAAESWDPENIGEYEKVVYQKSDEQKQTLLENVKGILLFRALDADDHNDVVDAMFERKVIPNEDVITIGEPGDNFYVIESGIYDVFVNVDGSPKKVSHYNGKGAFGELALMYNTPRAATVRAVTAGVLWAMSRETFRSIVLAKAFKKRKLYEELLESVDLLNALSPYERMSLADALYTRIVEEGQPVFLQGEVGQEMYFIESGSVVVQMQPEDESSDKIELCKLEQNQYFGELALLTKNPRAASVYALERTRLAVLEVDSFERILGPCQSLLERKAEEYAQRRQTVTTVNASDASL